MLKIEIAGQTVKYKNAPDLKVRIGTLLSGIRSQRTQLEDQSKALKKQERLLERFLGDSRTADAQNENGGSIQ